MVNKSFRSVLKDSEDLKESLQDFEQTFSSINTVSSQFAAVKDNIFQTVAQAQGEVDETYEMFDNITQAAEGAESVQKEISVVIDDSKTRLLGTTKSVMYEDFDNMMSQIPPVIRDYNAEQGIPHRKAYGHK